MGRLATEVGHPLVLLGQVVRIAVRKPKGYWGDVRDDMYYNLKKVSVPFVVAMFGYGMLASTFAVAIMLILGAPNRLGTVYLSFMLREISPFITGTVVAGVLGTSTTAEIGARKIREELDALVVLGQNPVRMLVLPRVITLTIMTCALNILGVVLLVGQGFFVVTTLGGTSASAYFANFMANVTVADILNNLFKTLSIGLFIGLICTSKGLRTTRGAEGLGRAVNQAVVVCVVAVFILNDVYNLISQGAVPEMTVSR